MQRSISAGTLGLFAILAMASTAARAGTIPELGITLSMGDVPVWSANAQIVSNADGTYSVPNGNYDGSGYSIRWWNMQVDADPFISGSSAIVNNSAIPQSFILTFTLPVSPALPATTLYGGSAGYTVTDSNFDGTAQLWTITGSPLYNGRIDGVNILPLFPDPTSVSVVVPGGTTTVNASAGLPGPTLPGPAVLSTIGIEHRFMLSPGDSVSFTSFFVVVPEPGTLGLLLLGGLMLRGRRQ